jgi:hypothetical protein
MNSATLKKANDLTKLLAQYDDLSLLVFTQLKYAKEGVMPNLSQILDLAFRLNVVTPRDMVPLLEKYEILTGAAREEVREQLADL